MLHRAGQDVVLGGTVLGGGRVSVDGRSGAEKLYQLAHAPVDIVAESEGTLGLYAMLARHPHLHVGSVVLLSPIVDPDQVGQAADSVPGEALITLNELVGGSGRTYDPLRYRT